MTPEQAACKIQRSFRKRIYRFHRLRFIERLELEIQLGVMGLRFWAYIVIFCLFVAIIRFPHDPNGDHMIKRQVTGRLSLDSLALKSRAEMQGVLGQIVDEIDAAFRPANTQTLTDVYAMTPDLFVLKASEASPVCKATVQVEAQEASLCPDYCDMDGCPAVANPSGTETRAGVTLYQATTAAEVPIFKFFDSLDLMFALYAPLVSSAYKSHLGILKLTILPDYSSVYELFFVDRVTDFGGYVTVVVFAYLLVFLMIFVDIWYITRVRKYVVRRTLEKFSHMFELSIMVVLVAFLSAHVSTWRDSHETFQEYTRKLAAISDVTDSYSFMNAAIDLNRSQERMRSFGLASLYLLLIRLSQSMLMHPRIALFVRTFTTAKSEIWHYFVTATILFMGLGMIGWTSLQFSETPFQSFRQTMWTQFSTVAAGSLVVRNWAEYPVYHVIFSLIVLLCLLNFFTAVIIDTYLKLREDVEKQITEQSVFADILVAFQLQYLSKKFGFPSRRTIIEKVRKMKALKTVTMANLYGTHLFKDAETCRKFCAAYRRFPFLHPFEFQAPGDIAERRWEKTFARLDDLAVDAHLDIEVMHEYDAELARRMETVEKIVDQVSQKFPPAESPASAEIGKRRHVATTFLRKKRNIFDEYRVRRETLKKVNHILHERRIKQYMQQASGDAGIKFLIERKLHIRRQSTFKPNRRRTLTNSANINSN